MGCCDCMLKPRNCMTVKIIPGNFSASPQAIRMQIASFIVNYYLFSPCDGNTRIFQNNIGKNIFSINTLATYRILSADTKTKQLCPNRELTQDRADLATHAGQVTRKLCQCTPLPSDPTWTPYRKRSHSECNGCFMGVTHGKIFKINLTFFDHLTKECNDDVQCRRNVSKKSKKSVLKNTIIHIYDQNFTATT